jgi:hypothetical protein
MKRPRKTHAKASKSPRRWSARVTRGSNALDLESGVFKLKDPKRIAASLKRSAERSTRRKSSPYRSALSMLTLYINRAGSNLPGGTRKTLQTDMSCGEPATDRAAGQQALVSAGCPPLAGRGRFLGRARPSGGWSARRGASAQTPALARRRVVFGPAATGTALLAAM